MEAETKAKNIKLFESELWKAACKLWTNSKLRPSDYKNPILAIIFLKCADDKFTKITKKINKTFNQNYKNDISEYKKRKCLYLSAFARWNYIKSLSKNRIFEFINF